MARVYGSCYGKDGSAYDFYMEYSIQNNTLLIASTYVRRNDGYPNTAYNLIPGQNKASISVVGNTTSLQTYNAPTTLTIDTRNGKVSPLVKGAQFILAEGDTVQVTAQFTTDTNSLKGGNLSFVLNVPIATVHPPTSFVAIGRNTSFYDGDVINLTWNESPSSPDFYEIQVAVANKDTGVYGSWLSLGTTTSTSLSTTYLGSVMCGSKIRFRIRAVKSTVGSDWVTSNELIRSGAVFLDPNNDGWKKATVWVKINNQWVRVKTCFSRPSTSSIWKEVRS